MQVLGQFLVSASLVLTAFVAALSLAGAVRRHPRWVRAASEGVAAVAWLNVAIALLLTHALVTHDFSNRYVASYSDTTMPVFYLLTAFWAGEKGALLFWVVSLSLLAAALERVHRGNDSAFFGAVRSVVVLALIFFDILMVFASHPFETFLTSEGPADGSGMNPLLQNPLMAIHPPFQLAGFVAYTVPFAFSVAALITGRLDDSWIRESRRWNLLAWTLLTAGLIIGGLWAYVELGWGGFWGWDPVENAALLPWLSGTALLHSTAVEVRRGMLRRWNHVLIALTFLLTIFATFLTRSQLISSLHAFSNSVLTPFFVDYLAVLALTSGALIAWRWRALAPRERIRGLWTRETLVVANSILFLVAIFVVLWGTLLPKFSESPRVQDAINAAIALWNQVSGAAVPPLRTAITVGPEWFNRVVAPVGLLILGLTALGPLVPFRTGGRGAVNRAALRTGLASLGATVVVVLAYGAFRVLRASEALDLPWTSAAETFLGRLSLPAAYGAAGVLLATWVLLVAARDTIRSVAARRAVTGASRLRTAWTLLRDNPRRYGGHAVHVGVALCFLSFAGAAVREERKDVVLKPGERLALGGEDLVLLGTRETFSDTGGFASSVSEVLAWPRGKPVPQPVKTMLEGLPDVRAVEALEAPEVALRFGSADEARRFFANAFARTVIARDFQVVRMDRALREIHLAPSQPETLQVIPRAFHRLTEELREFSRAVGEDRLVARSRRGDPLIVVTVADADLFGALASGLEARGSIPVAFALLDPDAPDRVRVVPSGLGRLLAPETRFYPKFESPTSEVDIETGLLYDLYVAAAPGTGTRSASVTAMVNPLMSWLWAGSVVLLGFGFVLALGGRAARPVREPAGEAEGARPVPAREARPS